MSPRLGSSLPDIPPACRLRNPSSAPAVLLAGERMVALAFRSPSWRATPAAAVRAFSSSRPSATEDRSRGGLPRFYSHVLPSSKGDSVRVRGDEFWHMTKVLRLRVNDRVELFNGRGGVVEGYVQNIDRTGLDFLALNDPKAYAPTTIQWHVFAAFGSLKGGRGDWLVEKCTRIFQVCTHKMSPIDMDTQDGITQVSAGKELGASSITPLLAERSPSITENRADRLQRVILAASKQCQRLHEMVLNPPMKFHDILPVVSVSKVAFLAAAGATPLVKSLHLTRLEPSGIVIIGPEGDFTEEEVKLMTQRGATPIGLGPCRLRVETATVALLSALMLWSDTEDLSHQQLQHTPPSGI